MSAYGWFLLRTRIAPKDGSPTNSVLLQVVGGKRSAETFGCPGLAGHSFLWEANGRDGWRSFRVTLIWLRYFVAMVLSVDLRNFVGVSWW